MEENSCSCFFPYLFPLFSRRKYRGRRERESMQIELMVGKDGGALWVLLNTQTGLHIWHHSHWHSHLLPFIYEEKEIFGVVKWRLDGKKIEVALNTRFSKGPNTKILSSLIPMRSADSLLAYYFPAHNFSLAYFFKPFIWK